MRYTEYYEGYCPEFRTEHEIALEFDEEEFMNHIDRKLMSYQCNNFGFCQQIDKFGACSIFLQLTKKFRK